MSKGNRTRGEGRRGGRLKRWEGDTHPTGQVKPPLRKGEAARLITPVVVERWASTWLPIKAIAAKIGTSERTLHRALQDNPSVQAAYNNGIAARSDRVAAGIDGFIGSNALVTLVAAQQAPEIGGLGWIRPGAPAQQHQHGGKITLEIVRRVMEPGEALPAPSIPVAAERIEED